MAFGLGVFGQIRGQGNKHPMFYKALNTNTQAVFT